MSWVNVILGGEVEMDNNRYGSMAIPDVDDG